MRVRCSRKATPDGERAKRQRDARLDHAALVVVGVRFDAQLAGLGVEDDERGVVVAHEPRAPCASTDSRVGVRFGLRQQLVVDVEQQPQAIALRQRFLAIALGRRGS